MLLVDAPTTTNSDIFTDIADYLELLETEPETVSLLRSMVANITIAMNEKLWDGIDHFITQVNPDGTKRDFVDFDSNLMAVAYGVASAERSKLILQTSRLLQV